MKLYVIRHAIAEDRRPGLAEEDRALTPAGIRKFEACVSGMRRMGVSFETILHSPLLRAIQTAEVLDSLAEGELYETRLLSEIPGPELLKLLENEECAAVVGHQPWLGQLIALLVCGAVGDRKQFELRKGGMAVLEGAPDAGGMVLRGLYSPRDLRLLGSVGVGD